MSQISTFHLPYLIRAVEGNAQVLSHLLDKLGEEDPLWDTKVDPERFTLREIVAHLLDFDTVLRQRFEHMIRENNPDLPNWDEVEAARHYDGRNPVHDLGHFRESRTTLAAWLHGLSEEEWLRTGTHPAVGCFSVWDWATLMLVHDGYHLEQVVAWLDSSNG